MFCCCMFDTKYEIKNDLEYKSSLANRLQTHDSETISPFSVQTR